MVKQLGIHVIGPRLGESIVLHLPDGGIGVIDSYACPKAPHPVVRFLKRRFSGVSGLRFFAITHPHADHCFRCAEVCAEYPPDEVWAFRPFPLGQLRDYYEAIQDLGSADSVERESGLPTGSVVHSLLKFEQQVNTFMKAGKIRYRSLAWSQPFTLCGGEVTIHFLTPGDKCQYTYSESISRSLQQITKDGVRLQDISAITEPRHNMASGGILLEYGMTRALLMADAEEELWTEWFGSNPNAAMRSPVQFLKASHHGSKNGYHAKLYSELADPKRTVAVVTPFNQGRVHLPEDDGIRLLRPHVKDVYCTSRDMASLSTSFNWEPIIPRPMPRFPGTWLLNVQAKPSLARLLTPAAGMASTGGPIPKLPADWVMAAHKKPELWHFLKPGLRQPIPGLVPAEGYTISAYLDDAGKLLKLSGGDGTGVLKL